MAGRIKDREDREVYSAPWIGEASAVMQIG